MNAMRRRGRLAALPLFVAAVSVVAATEAGAAGACYPREAMIAHLAERYGERPVGAGVAQGRLVLLLSRADGASWTILLVPPGGELACPLSVGEDWQRLDDSRPEAPAAPETSS